MEINYENRLKEYLKCLSEYEKYPEEDKFKECQDSFSLLVISMKLDDLRECEKC